MIRILAVVNFGTPFFSSLGCGFPQFSLCSLHILLRILTYLGLVNVASSQRSSISPVAPVRFERLFHFKVNYGEIYQFSDIPPSLPVKLKITHVSSEQFGHNSPILTYLTDNIVAPFAFNAPNFVPATHSVLFVIELAASANVVNQGAPQRVYELVLVGRVRDLTPVFEGDLFATRHVQINRVHVSFRFEGRVAVPAIQIVWTHDEAVRDGRMVTHLLHVHLRPVLQKSLESLAEDRIERFVEDVGGVEKTDRFNHHELHALNWILAQRRSSHIVWRMHRKRSDEIEHGLVRHALDWKGNAGQVEFAAKNGPANLFDHIFESVPILANHLRIV